MGVCQPQTKKQYEFTAYFSVNIKQLFDSYKEIVQFIRSSDFFSSSSQELLICIRDYLKNPLEFDKSNNGQRSIDSVHKLHPLDYNKQNVTQDWLLEACLRQNKFIKQFPMELLSFEQCYKHYVQYLYLIFKSRQIVVVPNKLADFMWHSHMQDNKGYKNDTLKMVGRVLNHDDNFSEEQLKKFQKQTEELRKKVLRVPQRNNYSNNISNSGGNYHSYTYINYGHSACGGSHPMPDNDDYPHPNPPHPPHPPHPHPDDHHPHPRPDDHHPHPNDHHHHHHHHDSGSNSNTHDHHSNNHGGYDHHVPSNDYTSPSNDNGGGGASNCGGGSSCGGGGSSCGGGGGGGD